jgi:catechol 2,3-dioxygenase-like lactoylglutathione lyase family enzyme
MSDDLRRDRQLRSGAPRLSHVLETSLYVEDLGVSRAFYERVLGLETLGQDKRMCAMAIPGSSLLLLFRKGGCGAPSPTPGGVIPAHGGDGVLHVCFAIPVSQLDQWKDHLLACDVPIESQVTQHFGGTSLYFRDPDGHSIEVATPGLWMTY